jgi:hypothetical protein
MATSALRPLRLGRGPLRRHHSCRCYLRRHGPDDGLTNSSALATIELHPTQAPGNLRQLWRGLCRPPDQHLGGHRRLRPDGNANNSGCNVQSAAPTSGSVPSGSPANCTGNNKFVQEFVGGFWYDFYKGPAGRIRLRRPVWQHQPRQSGAARPLIRWTPPRTSSTPASATICLNPQTCSFGSNKRSSPHSGLLLFCPKCLKLYARSVR